MQTPHQQQAQTARYSKRASQREPVVHGEMKKAEDTIGKQDLREKACKRAENIYAERLAGNAGSST